MRASCGAHIRMLHQLLSRTLIRSHSSVSSCILVSASTISYYTSFAIQRLPSPNTIPTGRPPKASSSSGAGIRTNEPAVTVAAAAVTALPSSLPCLIPRCLFSSSSRRRLSFCRLCSAMARLFLAVLVALVALAASSSAYAPGDCFTVTASRLNVRASPCTCVARARRSSPPTCALTP